MDDHCPPQLSEAVNALVLASGSLRERLVACWRPLDALALTAEQRFPARSLGTFRALRDELLSLPLQEGHETSVARFAREAHDEQLELVLKLLADLNDDC